MGYGAQVRSAFSSSAERLAVGAVDRGDHGAQARRRDRRGDADAPHRRPVDFGLDVGDGTRVVAGGQRVLGVVEDADVESDGRQRVDERRQRTVAATSISRSTPST